MVTRDGADSVAARLAIGDGSIFAGGGVGRLSVWLAEGFDTDSEVV